jgi:hypothetical protein
MGVFTCEMFFKSPFFSKFFLLVIKITPPDDGFVDLLCPFVGVEISHVFSPDINVFESLWRLTTLLGDADERLEIFVHMLSVIVSASTS